MEPWAAGLMGAISGSIPWYTMMVLHKKSSFFKKVDDTLGAFHTHAVAGTLGGLLSGILAKPSLLRLYYGNTERGPGLLYGLIQGELMDGLKQMSFQILGAVFVASWNVVITSFICIILSRFLNLRMDEGALEIGDDAAHGEEAYALWGDGEISPPYPRRRRLTIPTLCRGC